MNDYKNQLKCLIETVGLFAYVKSLKTKNVELLKWIIEETKSFIDISIGERVYIVLNGDKETICEYNNHKKFNSLVKGYRFCSNNCRCRREEQSRKILKHNSELSSDDRINRINKQKETIDNKISNDSEYFLKIEEKRQKTFNERYGKHPLSSSEIRDKIKETVNKRYGYDNVMSVPHIKQKSFDTVHERYGVNNVGQLETIKTKILETNLDKYNGHPSSVDFVKTKKKETNLERYGSENTMTIARESYRNNHDGKVPSQIHISDYIYSILNDRDKFIELMDGYSTKEAAISLGVGDTTILRYCFQYEIERSKSSYESAIIAFLKGNNISVKKNDRILLNGLEIDILLEEYKIGIEFTGFYWHSEKNLAKRNYDAKTYHLNKTKMMNSIGYSLITIFEDEWLFKRKIVEKTLLNLLGLSKEKDSSKLSIRLITDDEAKLFLEEHHIQGYVVGYCNYAAIDNAEIVAVMTFRKLQNGSDELVRFATNGENYSDIVSILFDAYLKESCSDFVIGYLDRRWGDFIYERLGFKIVGEIEPDFWYTKRGKIFNKNQITEYFGYDIIWDCGSLIYEWKRNN